MLSWEHSSQSCFTSESSEISETKEEAYKHINIILCVCLHMRMFEGLKLLLFVRIFAALCPEEAESALEATHFFTDDETPQGEYSDSYTQTWYNTHLCIYFETMTSFTQAALWLNEIKRKETPWKLSFMMSYCRVLLTCPFWVQHHSIF